MVAYFGMRRSLLYSHLNGVELRRSGSAGSSGGRATPRGERHTPPKPSGGGKPSLGAVASALRPLRSTILELLKLRRRAGLHADSQVRPVLCCAAGGVKQRSVLHVVGLCVSCPPVAAHGQGFQRCADWEAVRQRGCGRAAWATLVRKHMSAR